MSLSQLVELVGAWRGRSTLQDPVQGGEDTSESELSVHEVLAGRFVRLDYDWSYRGEPQEGSLLLGFQPETQEVSCHWIDSWHMGRGVMACTGERSEQGSYSLRGSYSVPGADPWGWRIEIAPAPECRLVMYNVSPQGEEFLAVEAIYSRV